MVFTQQAVPPALRQRLKLFFALSRTPHGIIDMAAPALAALLCLGQFPPLPVVFVGLITVFAGYTAVYALNDLVDLDTDKQKVGIGGYNDTENYLDGVLIRHPLAKGVLRFSAGLAWAAGWAVVAMAGAYWLNPVCFYLFLAGCGFEILYCKLWRVTPLRTVINGVVKTIGALAAAFAVDPSPPVFFMIVLFLWLFFWEIGGQNIPNDWTDIEEDRHFEAQTIPVKLGGRRAAVLSLAALVLVLFLNPLLLWASPMPFDALYLVTAVVICYLLLLQPALGLALGQQRQLAMDLFNKASYYPLAILGVVLAQMLQP